MASFEITEADLVDGTASVTPYRLEGIREVHDSLDAIRQEFTELKHTVRECGVKELANQCRQLQEAVMKLNADMSSVLALVSVNSDAFRKLENTVAELRAA